MCYLQWCTLTKPVLVESWSSVNIRTTLSGRPTTQKAQKCRTAAGKNKAQKSLLVVIMTALLGERDAGCLWPASSRTPPAVIKINRDWYGERWQRETLGLGALRKIYLFARWSRTTWYDSTPLDAMRTSIHQDFSNSKFYFKNLP